MLPIPIPIPPHWSRTLSHPPPLPATSHPFHPAPFLSSDLFLPFSTRCINDLPPSTLHPYRIPRHALDKAHEALPPPSPQPPPHSTPCATQVPDLLLQAECSGRLELPDPLPWGYASVPSLYELAGLAEEEVVREREEQQRMEEEAREGRQRRRREEQQRRERARREAGAEGEVGGRESVEGEEQDGEVVVGGEAGGQQLEVEGKGAPAEGAEGANDGDVSMEHGGRHGQGAQEQGALDGQQEQQHREEECNKQQKQQQGEGNGLEAQQAAGGTRGAGNGGPGLWRGGTEGVAAAGTARAAPPSPTATGNAMCRAPVDGDGCNVADGGGAARGATRDVSPPASSPEADELQPPPAAALPYACHAFLDSLAASRTYRSPHCEAAMADVMGMAELYDGLAGTTLAAVSSVR